MNYRVFVDGQEGTTGLRIHEYLAQRSDIEVLRIDADKRKDAGRARAPAERRRRGLPVPARRRGEGSRGAGDQPEHLPDRRQHRAPHRAGLGVRPARAGAGQRAALRAAKRIANPGCHASAFILLLRPLVDAGLVPAALPLSATSITGYSGGGKKMIEQYEAGGDARLDAPRPYALALAHKHVPEMTAHTGLAAKPVFMPIVGTVLQGLGGERALASFAIAQWHHGASSCTRR